MILRSLVASDLRACRELWQARFSDSEPFVNWFFMYRFQPACGVGLFDDTRLISMSLGYPMSLTRPNGSTIASWMLSGISTATGYEKRGCMHRVVRLQMEHARMAGIPVVFNHPVNLHQYDSLGFRPITHSRYLNAEVLPTQPMDGSRLYVDCDVSAAYAVYQRNTDRYYGFVHRSKAEFDSKMQDYFSDGGRVARLTRGDETVGYCVYYLKDEMVHVEECLTDPALYHHLLSSLAEVTGEWRMHAKLPPDIRLPGKVLPQNVAAFTDPGKNPDEIARLFSPDGSQGKCFCVDEY